MQIIFNSTDKPFEPYIPSPEEIDSAEKLSWKVKQLRIHQVSQLREIIAIRDSIRDINTKLFLLKHGIQIGDRIRVRYGHSEQKSGYLESLHFNDANEVRSINIRHRLTNGGRGKTMYWYSLDDDTTIIKHQ